MNNPLYVAYHDEEWGNPFMMTALFWTALYGDLSGWSVLGNWYSTNARLSEKHFMAIKIQAVAEMTDGELEALLENPAIIRNRAKLFATRSNIQAFYKFRKHMAPLMPISGLLSMDKPSSMMSPTIA